MRLLSGKFYYIDILILFYNASVEKHHQTAIPRILFNENLNSETAEVKLLRLLKLLSSLSFFEILILKAHEAEEEARMNPEFADRMKQLDKEASYYREECGKAQAEVDRLLEILKEVENEKNDKDKKIAELER